MSGFGTSANKQVTSVPDLYDSDTLQ
jgi:hypothetical protein